MNTAVGTKIWVWPYALSEGPHCTCTWVNNPWLDSTELHTCIIREHGSILYLGMATEILNLPWLCITQITAKEATNPKPSMQREWYCLAVHKYTRECTFEYVGAEKQTAEKVGFRHLSFFLSFFLSSSHTKLLTSIAYKLKHLLSYFTHRTISLSS